MPGSSVVAGGASGRSVAGTSGAGAIVGPQGMECSGIVDRELFSTGSVRVFQCPTFNGTCLLLVLLLLCHCSDKGSQNGVPRADKRGYDCRLRTVVRNGGHLYCGSYVQLDLAMGRYIYIYIIYIRIHVDFYRLLRCSASI